MFEGQTYDVPPAAARELEAEGKVVIETGGAKMRRPERDKRAKRGRDKGA
jgi:hypothetical protein